jgi:hypothetical protein
MPDRRFIDWLTPKALHFADFPIISFTASWIYSAYPKVIAELLLTHFNFQLSCPRAQSHFFWHHFCFPRISGRPGRAIVYLSWPGVSTILLITLAPWFILSIPHSVTQVRRSFPWARRYRLLLNLLKHHLVMPFIFKGLQLCTPFSPILYCQA